MSKEESLGGRGKKEEEEEEKIQRDVAEEGASSIRNEHNDDSSSKNYSGPSFKDQARSVAATTPGAVPRKNTNQGEMTKRGDDRRAGPSFKDKAQSHAAVTPGATKQTTSELPSFKDQVQNRGQQLTENRRGATRASAADAKTTDGLPTFKDQAQGRREDPPLPTAQSAGTAGLSTHEQGKEHQEPIPQHSGGAATAAGLPSFKDQARERAADEENAIGVVQQQQRQLSAPAVAPRHSTHDDVSSSASEGPRYNTFLVEAQVVNDNDFRAEGGVPSAEAVEGGVFVNRLRLIVFMLAMLAILGAIVGGFCGTGNCSPSKDASPESPTAALRTLTPTSAPTITSRASDILDYINSITFSTEAIRYPAFENQTSTPEEQAVEWLIQDDPLELSVVTNQSRLMQRYALATIAFGTGLGFGNHDSWLSEDHECFWYGIDCDSDSDGQPTTVLTINLSDLDGRIPADIALLSNITEIDLKDNSNLQGTLPSSIGKLELLEYFNVDDCRLSGTLPTSIRQWTNLKLFSIQENSFTGPLPESIGNWKALFYFGILGNSLNGTLPESIGEWTALEWFDISDNDLTGTLPESIGEWTALEWFLINDNDLTGMLSESIGNWTALNQFNIGYNDFSGTLPESIEGWTALNGFTIRYNDLTGTLPESIGEWTALNWFFVQFNELTGTLPESIGNWSNVFSVDLSNNAFNGTIPESILNWKNTSDSFSWAFLNNNSFTGTFASEICYTILLYYVDCDEVDCPCCINCLA